MTTDLLVQYRAALPLLEEIPSEMLSSGNAYQGLPVPGSQAGREQAALPSLPAPATAFIHAGVQLVAAGNNLLALRRALTEPSLSLAPWGLARSVLELCSVAAWLLDPDIAPEERARRAFNVRVRDIRRNAEYLESLTSPTSSAIDIPRSLQHLESRLDEIAQQAGTLGFAAKNDRTGRLRFVGSADVPGTTTLTREIFGQPDVWHLLSGAEHGRSWALLGLGMDSVEERSAPGMSFVEESLHIASALWLITFPLAWFTRVAWNRAAIAGWPLSPLATLLAEAAHILEVQPSHHFWADARTSGGTTVLRDLTIDPPPSESNPE